MSSLAFDISALDPKFKEHSTRGIGRYARELKKYFDENNIDFIDYFDHLQISDYPLLSKLINYAPAGRHTLKQQLLYPLRLNSGNLRKIDVLHFLSQTDPPSWCPKKYILSVHDIIPFVCKDLYKSINPNWRFQFARFLEVQGIKNASLILTISENSKKDIMRILNVPEEKIKITYLGVDNDYFSKETDIDYKDLQAKFNIKNDFLLYVGGIDPRKNSQGLVEIYSNFIKRCQEKSLVPPQLLFAGRINKDKEYPNLLKKIKELGLEDYILMPGFVEDSDLLALYKYCKAFCFFSLYEGFGLTPLEALAAGAPVISSNLSAMPEVLGQAAILVDPHNIEETGESLFSLVFSPELQAKYKELGPKQARKFPWSATCEATIACYQNFFASSK